MAEYCFDIAGIRLVIEAERKYIAKEIFDFEADSQSVSREKVVIRIIEGEYGSFADSRSEQIVNSDVISVSENEDYFIVKYNRPAVVDGYAVNKSCDEAYVFINHAMADKIEDGNLLYAVRDAFFCLIQRKGRIVVHSASIVYGGKVWLFAAPSGTGKSTHVKLWKELEEGARDFNGDIAAVYRGVDGTPLAAGLPWCGTSGLYVNEILPLGGILFLERAEQNELVNISEFEGITALAARCVTPSWNSNQVEMNIASALEIVPHIALARLKCTPSYESVRIARSFVDKNL